MAKVIRHENHLQKEIRRTPRTRLLILGVVVFVLVVVVHYLSVSIFRHALLPSRFYLIFTPIWLLYMLIVWNIGRGKTAAILQRGLEGEQYTEKLLSRLPDTYTVISDLTIRAGGEESQIDHVVVGPTGIFVIETKNLKGIITGNLQDHELYQQKVGRGGEHYGKSFYNPVKQVSTHVFRVAQFLREQGLPTWVQGMVFFANEETQIHIQGLKNSEVPVFSVHDGEDRLLNFILHATGNGLSEQRQQKIVHYIRGTL